MKFIETKKHLVDLFKSNNFEEDARNNCLHTNLLEVEALSNGSKIFVSFPGYKSIRYNEIVYDYRVDISKNEDRVALSHANIITDLFNKVKNVGMAPMELANALIESSIESTFELDKVVNNLKYNPVKPNKDLISRVNTAHGNKTYNQPGNAFDLTIEELFSCIKWIVIQEDINYPISSHCQGRRMPFSRYIEAVFTAQSNTHRLEEVIQRALSHFIPPEWNEIDYSFALKIH